MKQRLIGAAVLVALAVIFLPMLIGGPRESDIRSAPVPLDMPERDGRHFETRDLTLPPPAPAIAPMPDALQDAAAPGEADRIVTIDTTDAPARIDAVSGAPVGTVAPAPAATAPVTAPPPVSTPAPVATPAPKPAPRPVSAAEGRYAVNLGSYANEANAASLVAQLRQQRLPAYSETTTLAGKSVQRVRVGPYAQRSEAESARLDVLKVRSDLPNGIVSLEGERNAPVAARPAVAEGFAVQIGALRSEADANALRDRARAVGFSSYVERVDTATGRLWRVRLGPELQRANADKLKTDAKAKLGVDGNVVPHP